MLSDPRGAHMRLPHTLASSVPGSGGACFEGADQLQQSLITGGPARGLKASWPRKPLSLSPSGRRTLYRGG